MPNSKPALAPATFVVERKKAILVSPGMLLIEQRYFYLFVLAGAFVVAGGVLVLS